MNTADGDQGDKGRVCPDCGAHARTTARFCRSCRADLRGEAAAALVPAAFEPATDRPRLTGPARRRLIAAAATAGAVLVAFGVFYWVQDGWYSPEGPVVAYFDSLDARANYTPPTDVDVVDVAQAAPDPRDETRRPSGDSAHVTVAYTLAGDRHESTLRVSREAGGWFRSWDVADGQHGTLQATTAGHVRDVDVAGTTLETVADSLVDNAVLTVAPGVYTITLPDNPLLEMDPIEVAVPAGAKSAHIGRSVSVAAELPWPTVRDDVDAAVQDLVENRWDDCAADGGRNPGCGWSGPDDAMFVDYSTLEWDVVSYPEIEVELVDVVADRSHTRHDPPARVTTVEPGEVALTWKQDELFDEDQEDTHTQTITREATGGVDVTDAGQLAYPA